MMHDYPNLSLYRADMVFAPSTSLSTISECIGEFKDASKESIWMGRVQDTIDAGNCFGRLSGKYSAKPVYKFGPEGKRSRETQVNDYDSSGKFVGSHVKWVADPK